SPARRCWQWKACFRAGWWTRHTWRASNRVGFMFKAETTACAGWKWLMRRLCSGKRFQPANSTGATWNVLKSARKCASTQSRIPKESGGPSGWKLCAWSRIEPEAVTQVLTLQNFTAFHNRCWITTQIMFRIKAITEKIQKEERRHGPAV